VAKIDAVILLALGIGVEQTVEGRDGGGGDSCRGDDRGGWVSERW
jgi:hypothetical protein